MNLSRMMFPFRPQEPPKKPEAAPFFLDTVPSLDPTPQFVQPEGDATGENKTSRIMQHKVYLLLRRAFLP